MSLFPAILLGLGCFDVADNTVGPSNPGEAWPHDSRGQAPQPDDSDSTKVRESPEVTPLGEPSVEDLSPGSGIVNHEEEPPPTLRFAVIGDFGTGDGPAGEVAALVASWNVDFILTVGDNNYPSGEVETLDDNVGQFYSAWIHPYQGSYGTGADENRFWPCPGNHDWNYELEWQPYTDYFELPGNERYYELVRGPAHFFCVNSDIHEPDTNAYDGVQGQWLEAALAASTSSWKVVFQHHQAYSSGTYGDDPTRQWPFEDWGANLFFNGHEHDYERLHVGGLTYVITGTGGTGTRSAGTFNTDSQAFWTDRHGAVLVELSQSWGRFVSYDTLGAIGDQWYEAPGVTTEAAVPLFPQETTWRYLAGPAETPAGWNDPDHDDSEWYTAVAPVGVGADITTELEDAGAVQTIYMRSSFAASDVDDVMYLVLRLRRDDGAIVYLNGEEIYRVGLVEGETPSATTPAAFAVEDEWETVYSETLLWPTHLAEGRNTVALEVHRAGGGDGDVFADMALLAIRR